MSYETFLKRVCIAVAVATMLISTQKVRAKSEALDINAAQAILAVQALDGWLLRGHGSENKVAKSVLAVSGDSSWEWYFWVPAEGKAVLLHHVGDTNLFSSVKPEKRTYSSAGQMKRKLKLMLGGASTVAMEYAPKSGMERLTQVPLATVKRLKSSGLEIVSSAELVQYTKARWGAKGRIAHYVAAHHLETLAQLAFDFVGREIRAGKKVTEHTVSKFIAKGFKDRGLVGPAPTVAVMENTKKASHAPSIRTSATLVPGQILVIQLAGRVEYADIPIYAEGSWVAFLGRRIPENMSLAFSAVVGARDTVLDELAKRFASGRTIKGYEVDQIAKKSLTESGFKDAWTSSTGHSMDGERYGSGANLDDGRARDTRSLVKGTGFVVGPSIQTSLFGVRSAVSAYFGNNGLEVTMELQNQITSIDVSGA